MRKLTLTLTIAAAAGLAAPALNPAQAQWDAVRRRTEGVITRGGVYDRSGVYNDRDVYDSRTASRVPPGQMPPRGYCRVWIDGVPPGQQPPVTDCQTAERQRYRYGSRARVLYGNGTSRNSTYGVRDSRSRTYDTVINGRRCRVTEWWDGSRTQRRTSCESDRDVWARQRAQSTVYGRNSGVYDDRYGRVRNDDDSDGKGKKYKAAKQHGNGNGKGKGKGNGRWH